MVEKLENVPIDKSDLMRRFFLFFFLAEQNSSKCLFFSNEGVRTVVLAVMSFSKNAAILCKFLDVNSFKNKDFNKNAV